MKEYKKITYGELDGVATAEVMAGKSDSIFVDRTRYYKNLTPSTLKRLARICNHPDFIPGLTK